MNEEWDIVYAFKNVYNNITEKNKHINKAHWMLLNSILSLDQRDKKQMISCHSRCIH